MKVIIAGSRSFGDHDKRGWGQAQRDWELLCSSMARLQSPVTEVVSGGAKGADRLGEVWSQKVHLVPMRKFKANWERLGNQAGIKRNCEMAEYADGLVAFWDGKSPGTKHMIYEMKRRGKPVFVVRFE
jgi:hypothetical protein